MQTIPRIESSSGCFVVDFSDDLIAMVTFNDKEKSVNAFSKPILEDFDQILQVIFATENLKGLVFKSGKKGSFAAGVDISIFDTLNTAEDGEQAARTLQNLFERLENAKVPTVAAIEGTCLGGGLELSLACHYRIASLSDSTKLGLPEVQIGLLPGGGGTQRLPRLIGLQESLALILTGKQIDSKKAKKIGLVDETLPSNQVLEGALKICRTKKPIQRKSTVSIMDELGDLQHIDMNKIALEGNPLGRALIRKKSQDQVNKTTKGHYPAPIKALESVMWGISRSFEAGLAREAKLFGELVSSNESKALIHIFRIMTAAKKNPATGDLLATSKKQYAEPISTGKASVGIIGAGLMGSGIATVLASKSIRTILQDKDPAGVGRGLTAVQQFFDEKTRKKRMRNAEKFAALSTVCPSIQYNALAGAKIVIEAVFEELSLKHEILSKCEAVCPEDFIFASNTSSIPITQIASKAQRPENVVGMHFFSPVTKMPLVEVIKTPQSKAEAVAAVFELATKMGKNIIVVNDGPGFYTTRILAFLIAEALNILAEGAAIEDVDKALESFGLPVGPVTLLDEVGIDVGSHIIKVLKEPFGNRLKVPAEVEPIAQENRKGRKNNFGFYTYVDGKKGAVDSTIYKHFKHGHDRLRMDRKEIADRCVYVFMNEAARCLDERIIESPDAGDLGAVFGLGFPPFLGGPFHYAAQLGHKKVIENLRALSEKFGTRFEPAAYWFKETNKA